MAPVARTGRLVQGRLRRRSQESEGRKDLLQAGVASDQVCFDPLAIQVIRGGVQVLGDLGRIQVPHSCGSEWPREFVHHSLTERSGRTLFPSFAALRASPEPFLNPLKTSPCVRSTGQPLWFTLHTTRGAKMLDTEKVAKRAAAAEAVTTDCEKKKRAARGRDSRSLSWLAETADGSRDQVFKLVYRNGKELKLLKPQEVGAGDQTICDVTTPSCRPDRLKAVAVHVFVEGDPNPIKIDVQANGGDAIFLTESAVEKFLYPYYRSQRIWDDDMDSLQQRFEANPQAVGVLHKAPSNSDTFSPGGTLEVAGPSPDGTVKWLALPEFVR
jgi:hypothetical protein